MLGLMPKPCIVPMARIGTSGSVAVHVNEGPRAVPQIGTIAAVVPDGRAAAVTEAARFRVVRVRVNPANLPRVRDVAGEGEHVVGLLSPPTP